MPLRHSAAADCAAQRYPLARTGTTGTTAFQHPPPGIWLWYLALNPIDNVVTAIL